MISIIFSFKNEEKNIPILVEKIKKIFDQINHDFEIIFVNDRSTDSSLELLTEINKKDPRVKVLTTSRCFGNSPCVIAGMNYAKGDAIIYMDSDLQDPPELIPQLVQKWEEGNEIVHTRRTKRHGENPIKMWITRRAYNIINLFSDIELPENVGDYKLLSKRAVKELLKIDEKEPYMRGLVTWIGFRQATILYERNARHSGKSQYPLFGRGPFYAFIAGITSFSNAPLYFALFFGFIVSLFSIVFLGYILVSRIFFSMHLPGWPALMATVLFTGGVILFTIGIIGVYVGKIAVNLKKRPLYIIDTKLGFDE